MQTHKRTCTHTPRTRLHARMQGSQVSEITAPRHPSCTLLHAPSLSVCLHRQGRKTSEINVMPWCERALGFAPLVFSAHHLPVRATACGRVHTKCARACASECHRDARRRQHSRGKKAHAAQASGTHSPGAPSSRSISSNASIWSIMSPPPNTRTRSL